MVFAEDDGSNRELVFAVAHVSEMLTALKANYYAAWHGDPPQRLSVDILVNADALAVTELDLDQAAALPGRYRHWGFNRSDAFGCSRGDPNRDKARSRRSDSRQAGPPPPREHQTRRNAGPSRDLRHHRAGRQRLLDDPHLIVARPATATLNPAQNLYPHQPTLRL